MKMQDIHQHNQENEQILEQICKKQRDPMQTGIWKHYPNYSTHLRVYCQLSTTIWFYHILKKEGKS